MTYRKEDELEDETFHLRLASIMLKYLKERSNGVAEPGLLIDNVGIFFDSVLSQIKGFARTQIESDALIVQLLEKVLNAGICPFYNALLDQEIHKPEKIFDVSPKPVAQAF